MNDEIKLIAMDLDGTALKDDKSISEYTFKVLTECINRGIYIVPATGRPMCAIPENVMNIKGIRYVITSNGASVIDVANNINIRNAYLEKEKAILVLNLCNKKDVWKECCIDGISYASSYQFDTLGEYIKDERSKQYLLNTRKKVIDVNAHVLGSVNKIERVSFFSNNLEELNRISKKASIIPDLSVTYAMPQDLEIGHSSANKGDALKYLSEELKIDKDNIMAFGDGHNDISMIRYSKIGVAMGNADNTVKENADITALTNEQDGLAKVIEKYVLSSP